MKRRDFLKVVGVSILSLSFIGVGALPTSASATTPALEEALRKQLGVDLSAIKETNEITVKAPTIAESGANVPIEVSSTIPIDKVEALYIFVDKNPNPFIAQVEMSPLNGEVYFATRIRMGNTSPVRAVLKLKDGSFLMAYKEVKVTVGGCG